MYNIIDGYINRGREEARKAYETVLAEKDRAMMEKDLTISRMAQELRELKLQYGIA